MLGNNELVVTAVALSTILSTEQCYSYQDISMALLHNEQQFREIFGVMRKNTC